MSHLTLGVVCTPDEITTARYYEAAAREAGHTVHCFTALEDPRALDGLDALLVFDPWMSGLDVLAQAPCPTIGYLIDVHRWLEKRVQFARYLDHVFIAQPVYRPAFEAIGHPSVGWLALACAPDVHFVPDQERIYDVAFVGRLGKKGSRRHRVLKDVLSAFKTNDYTRFHAPAAMGAAYSQAKIVINHSIGDDLNMRFFEGIGAGALMVTDRIENGLETLGVAGEHYVTFSADDDVVALVRYHLEHEAERVKIAQAGQAWAFAAHTYAHRLEEMLAPLRAGGAMQAPARLATRAQEVRWRSQWLRLNGSGWQDARAVAGAGARDPTVLANVAIGVGQRSLKRAEATFKGLMRKR